MENPCNTCLVKPCCAKRCLKYAEWFFESGGYIESGYTVKKQIESMTRDKAISYILMIENIVLDLNKGTMGV